LLTVSFIEAGKALNENASRLAEKGASCRIAVAFLRNEGMDRLDARLRLARGKIIVGASSFHITEGEALDRLRRICETNPRLSVKKCYNEKFHPKLSTSRKEEKLRPSLVRQI
jgi:HKD family nuclease